MSLTPKQEAFARAYVETGNASEAYRRAYDAENMKREGIAVEACKLLDNPKVARMVEMLKEDALQRHRVTVDDLLRELEEARIAAYQQEKPQASAMVAASMGKAKLLGLEAPSKVQLSGDADNPIVAVTLGKEEYKAARAEMLKGDDV